MIANTASEYQDRFFCRNPGLRQPLELMRAVPNASFFVKDLGCRYVMANAVHLGIYDLQLEDDLVGRTGAEFFPDLLAQAYLANDRRVLESAESLQNEVWLIPHIHGLPRWHLSNKSPLFDPEGKVMGLAALMYVIATPEHQRTHFQELERVIAFLEGGFIGQVSVSRLAGIAGISVAHLNRRFRQLLRLSPMEYVHSLTAARIQASTGNHGPEHWPHCRRRWVLRSESLHETIPQSNRDDATRIPQALSRELGCIRIVRRVALAGLPASVCRVSSRSQAPAWERLFPKLCPVNPGFIQLNVRKTSPTASAAVSATKGERKGDRHQIWHI